MKDFKKLIREAHLGNPLNEVNNPNIQVENILKKLFGKKLDPSVIAILVDEINDIIKKRPSIKDNPEEIAKELAKDSDIDPKLLLKPRMGFIGEENDEETDYMRRRRGDYSDDMEDGMTDYERRRRETSDYMNENMEEWPKELTSRYSDEYRFELEKVMSDRAKYRVIDIESGELKGTPVFGKPESLMAYADNLIKPQGGTQSSHFGTNEGTCGYGEDGKVDPENTDKLKPAGPANEMLMQALPVEKLTDKALLNLLNNLDDDTGKFTSAKSQLMKAAGDEVKRRGLKIHYVDNDRYEFMNEDMNDPVLVKARAAKMADEKEKAKQAALNKKYGSSFMDKLDAEIDLKQELQDLKNERAQLMIDMEQEAEPEGGEIADLYGMKLNRIDLRTAEIRDELEDLRMYESVNEGYLERAIEDEKDPKKLAMLKAKKEFYDNNPKEKRREMSDKEIGDEVRRLLKRNFMEEENGGAKQDDEQLSLNVSSDAALDNAVAKMGYSESLQESLRKKLRERLK